MLRLGIWLTWLALYQYYIEQICELEKGRIKRIAVWGITGGTALAVWALAVSGFSPFAGGWLVPAGWLLIVAVLFLYVLFYDAAPFRQQWRRALAPGFVLIPGALAETPVILVLANGAVMLFFLLMLAYANGREDFYGKGASDEKASDVRGAPPEGRMFHERRASHGDKAFHGDKTFHGDRVFYGKKEFHGNGNLRLWNSLADIAVYGIISLYLWKIRETADTGTLLGFLAVELLVFLSLEGTFSSYRQGFQAQTERFQRDILSHQYEEVKEIYLNMRGWRHDYHNHLQVMKAQIAAGQLEEMKQYLNDLEQNLDKVDTYVKSGNLMTDAILNSKLSLAEQKGIRVNCKAVLPRELSVEDVDLCVMLGNLLDNALEACDKIPERQRFLRIYMVVNRSQLYVSIQNSAREELDFNERNYISTKRGNHGLGMKRVKALADKYDGYLTLANEPGIFAAEMTLPL